PIGRLTLKIADDHIGGTQLLPCYINNMTVIDQKGNSMVINPGSDTVLVSNISTAINGANNQDAIHIFPIPARDKIFVDMAATDVKEISVINLIGETVYPAFESTARLSLNIANLSNGVYVLKIRTDKGYSVGRFCKL